MELNFNELFVLDVFRKFDFLRKLGYESTHVSIYGRDPLVVFENISFDRRISISWEGDFSLTIERKKKLMFKREETFLILSDYYKHFSITPKELPNMQKIILLNA